MFRRKAAQQSPAEEPAEEFDSIDDLGPGPHDSDAVNLAEGTYADLGSLWIAPTQGKELRLQVDEASGVVESVVIVGPDGGVELRAFAAPRNGDLWSQVRPQLVDDVVSKGGEHTEQDGARGPELLVRLPVQLADGRTGEQRSRMLGINGPRWFLRASFLGSPAVSEEAAAEWLPVLDRVIVHRGTGAMPSGEALPVRIPGEARRLS